MNDHLKCQVYIMWLQEEQSMQYNRIVTNSSYNYNYYKSICWNHYRRGN